MGLLRALRRTAEPTRRRALEFLASSSQGRTMLDMITQDFTPHLVADLVRDGLATTTSESFIARGYRGERTRVWITGAGRQTTAS
jgi:hypothetical protein